MLQVEIFQRRILVDDGTVLQQNARDRVRDHMQQLNDELEMQDEPDQDSDDPFQDL